MLSVLHKMSFMLSVHMLIDIYSECMLYVIILRFIMLSIVLYDEIMQNVDKQDVITVNVTDYSKLLYSVECFCSFVFMV
jgi:hypothetical protein